MSDEFNLNNVSIHGYIFMDDDKEEKIEILSELPDIEIPAELDSQMVNIDKGNPDNSAIIFSDGLPEDGIISQGSVEVIAVSIDDDGDISFTLDLSTEFIETAEVVIETLLDSKELHISDFDLDYSIQRGFGDIGLSVEGPSEFQFKGVRFDDGKYDFIVQSSNTDDWNPQMDESAKVGDVEGDDSEEEDGDESITSVSVFAIQHFDVQDSSDFIRARIEEVEERIRELTG